MYERPLHGSQGVFEIEIDGTEHHHRTHESGRDPIDSLVFIHDPAPVPPRSLHKLERRLSVYETEQGSAM